MIHEPDALENPTQPVFPEGFDPIAFNGVLNDLSQLFSAPTPGLPVPSDILLAFATVYSSSSSSELMDYAKLRRDVLRASVNLSLMSEALNCFKQMLDRLLVANRDEMGRAAVLSYLSQCISTVFPKYLREPPESTLSRREMIDALTRFKLL